jgi:hypothetical protein
MIEAGLLGFSIVAAMLANVVGRAGGAAGQERPVQPYSFGLLNKTLVPDGSTVFTAPSGTRWRCWLPRQSEYAYVYFNIRTGTWRGHIQVDNVVYYTKNFALDDEVGAYAAVCQLRIDHNHIGRAEKTSRYT